MTVYYNVNYEPCAYEGCIKDDCLSMRHAHNDKLLRLPSCPDHTKILSTLHKEYKQFSAVSEKLKQILTTINDFTLAIDALKILKKTLKAEIDGRILQGKTIKAIYCDGPHIHYLRRLISDYQNTRNALASLQKKYIDRL